MAYTRDIGREFWYDFDDQTLWNRTAEVSQALVGAYLALAPQIRLDLPPDKFRSSYGGTDHPAEFLAALDPGKPSFLDLGRIMLRIVDAHLSDDDSIRSAFEDFGQAVLFDDRRQDGFKVHMMDGNPTDWVGYQRWYAVMRALGLWGQEPARWAFLSRCLGLAWGIQTKVAPAKDVAGPGMDPQELSTYRTVWLGLTDEALDWAFAMHRYQAPELADLKLRASPPAVSGYARVQQILNDSVPVGEPRHGGHGKFWTKSYHEFMALPPIYGKRLIADPGPDRGARSGLVMALKGTLAPFPQMPLNNPPVSTEDIAWVQRWIDDGCPEV